MTLVKVNSPMNKTFDGLMNELFNELPVNFGKSIREYVLHFPPANIVEKTDLYKIELAQTPNFDTPIIIIITRNLYCASKCRTNSEAQVIALLQDA